ncbi:glycoside hydrolase family 88/105 protein [Paenibacillus pabuli]|uniref:glycoside hydrolase family 88/105 protein n=1 Tax=Paenibacillus pabuli TaxID=1472 RepID=UPI000783B85C|nr:glycoside hydrolase family 88 protein [Paenibacillus pabuli]MEC0125139.1 glycoside hydrolase family 88 protein [Paenibacillus pabuli]
MSRRAYFESEESMAYQSGEDIMHTLTSIAGRYIGANPPHPPVYRVSRSGPVRKCDDHRYSFPLGVLFPDMGKGQQVYAWAKLWSDSDQEFTFHVTCYGPLRLYHNGIGVFGSAPDEEYPAMPLLKLKCGLVKGWNHFVLEFSLGEKGLGGQFGTGSRKNKPLHFIVPSLEREGQEGWLYTEPLDAPLQEIPSGPLGEKATGVSWLPREEKPAAVAPFGQLARMYGLCSGMSAYAWAKINGSHCGREPVVFSGEAFSPVEFSVNGKLVFRQEQAGTFRFELQLSAVSHNLTANCMCGEQDWGFQLDPIAYKLLTPAQEIKGYSGKWLYLGPFQRGQEINLAACQTMRQTTRSGTGEEVYWRTGLPGGEVRPFLENEWFGRWNYPLGVTLYGLLQLGKAGQRPDIRDYVLNHIEFATSRFSYSLWDRARYGAAGLNNQLSHIDSLDDCGSFGATMLLADQERKLEGVTQTAAHIADYILHKQDRLEDGTLYRKVGVSRTMDNTMWCDDLYMSIPFLCRYAEWSGDDKVLDEAARQVLLYKKYLYIPERQIMSHVFDVERGAPTQTPWGRGNGWVLFSLSELLTVLSQEHPSFTDILQFYRELCAGYLELQGRNGLWHQVLTDPQSYEETSCTSMFIYSYARGARLGWFMNPEPYIQAVRQGWKGLTRHAIDKQGNVYGVCRGSSYSFSNQYYKHELGWNLNDTHGIGIVLLAGLETLSMHEWQASTSTHAAEMIGTPGKMGNGSV